MLDPETGKEDPSKEVREGGQHEGIPSEESRLVFFAELILRLRPKPLCFCAGFYAAILGFLPRLR